MLHGTMQELFVFVSLKSCGIINSLARFGFMADVSSVSPSPKQTEGFGKINIHIVCGSAKSSDAISWNMWNLTGQKSRW